MCTTYDASSHSILFEEKKQTINLIYLANYFRIPGLFTLQPFGVLVLPEP